MRHFLSSLAVTLTLSSVSAVPALAQDLQAQAAGRTLFDEAVLLMKDGRYAEACPKLESSLKAYPGIGTRGKLAECYEKQGRYASAWASWREVVQLSTRAGEPAREQFASERAKALEPKLAYITLTVSSLVDVPGLLVKRGGKEVERSKYGSAEPADPGILPIEISATGRKPLRVQIAIAQGQSKSFDIPILEPVDKAASIDVPIPPPPTPAFPQPVQDGSSWQKPVGGVAMGIGLVSIGLGAFFGLKAKSSYDAPFDSSLCDKSTNVCTSDGQSKVDEARSQATVSTVFFVAGGAVAIGGLVLFFTAPSKTTVGGVEQTTDEKAVKAASVSRTT